MYEREAESPEALARQLIREGHAGPVVAHKDAVTLVLGRYMQWVVMRSKEPGVGMGDILAQVRVASWIAYTAHMCMEGAETERIAVWSTALTDITDSLDQWCRCYGHLFSMEVFVDAWDYSRTIEAEWNLMDDRNFPDQATIRTWGGMGKARRLKASGIKAARESQENRMEDYGA